MSWITFQCEVCGADIAVHDSWLLTTAAVRILCTSCPEPEREVLWRWPLVSEIEEEKVMGQFIVHVDAMGNHGCERDKKDGETVSGCDQSGCTDCITRDYVRRLRHAGTIVSAATISHWPGTESEVGDDLVTGLRSGSF